MKKNTAILLIIVGVFAWGSVHALGAYLFNHNPWRGVMVMICVDGYLLFWLSLLTMQRQRTRNPRDEQDSLHDAD